MFATLAQAGLTQAAGPWYWTGLVLTVGWCLGVFGAMAAMVLAAGRATHKPLPAPSSEAFAGKELDDPPRLLGSDKEEGA